MEPVRRCKACLEADSRGASTSEPQSRRILASVMNTVRVILLICGLLLIADNVFSRTLYVINKNGGFNNVGDGTYNQNYFAPRRFLKISKRRDNFYPDYGYDVDTLMYQPSDNPFLQQEQSDDAPDSQFSRIPRQAERREAEDYYNRWIMSNMGK